jgi:hypothetical protein
MKANMNKLFSFSASDSEYFYDKQDKIELLSCPRKEMMCKEHLSLVNKCYVEAEHYRKEKDYERSIDTLKSAFYKTTELVDQSCSKCAELFRSTITESLENVHCELEKMSTGIFSKKRYQSSYLMADNILKEFENVRLFNTFQLHRSKDRFIGNYPKRKVS